MEIIFTKRPKQIFRTPTDTRKIGSNSAILVPKMVGQSVMEIPEGAGGTVWSSSNTCVNLKFGTRIVGLVSQEIQMAPANIFLDFPVRFDTEKCVRSENGINISSQTILFKNIPVFSGEILPGKINQTTKNKILSLLEEKNETSISSLIKNNANEKKWGELIGLGPGSTPSGDDFLCGVLAAEKLLNIKTNIATEISKFLTAETTTLLGYTLLKDALAKRFPMILHKMIHELQRDFSREFWYDLIYNSSHHSPADFCAGIMWGINLINTNKFIK